MRTAGSLLALALLVAGCAPSREDRVAMQEANAVAAAKLEKELAGLQRGATSTCMPRFPTSQVKAFGPTIVYQVSRGLKYRFDTNGGCERVARGDILITRSPMSQLCEGDIATTVDQGARTFSGSCSFGPFVRYSKQGS